MSKTTSLRVHCRLGSAETAFLAQDPLDIGAAVSEITVLRIAIHTTGFFGTLPSQTCQNLRSCGFLSAETAFLTQNF